MKFLVVLLKAKLHFDQSILIVSRTDQELYYNHQICQLQTSRPENISGGNRLSRDTSHAPALDSSWPTSSMASLWACSSCWGLPRSRSAVKFWSIQGARWWRASRGKWSPATHKHWTLHWRLKWGKYGNSGRIGPAWCVLISVCSHDLLFLFRPGEDKNL